MNKLCCIVNGTSNCSTCKRPLCDKHVLGKGTHYGYSHKVQRCLQCHRKFVGFHRMGTNKIPSIRTWYSQISRRQKKQGKKVTPKPRVPNFW